MTTSEHPFSTVTHDRRRELRVKIKSLAEEARIIRREERRCRDSMSRTVGHEEQVASLAASFASLRAHRTDDVRRESRYSLLAYALIRGRPLRLTEPKSDAAKIDRKKLASVVQRFGPGLNHWTRMGEPQATKMVEDWLAFM